MLPDRARAMCVGHTRNQRSSAGPLSAQLQVGGVPHRCADGDARFLALFRRQRWPSCQAGRCLQQRCVHVHCLHECVRSCSFLCRAADLDDTARDAYIAQLNGTNLRLIRALCRASSFAVRAKPAAVGLIAGVWHALYHALNAGTSHPPAPCIGPRTPTRANGSLGSGSLRVRAADTARELDVYGNDMVDAAAALAAEPGQSLLMIRDSWQDAMLLGTPRDAAPLRSPPLQHGPPMPLPWSGCSYAPSPLNLRPQRARPRTRSRRASRRCPRHSCKRLSRSSRRRRPPSSAPVQP